MAISRRCLLRNAGGISALSVIGSRAWAAMSRQQAELILHNGHIITIDTRQPIAEAIAIAGDRILAVGSNSDILGLASSGTKKVDLAGSTVVPGFIDAHTHPAYSGRRHLRFVDCDLRSIGAIQAAIRKRAAITPAGEWITGFKYDDTKMTEPRFLTREDLDAAAPQHMVALVGFTGWLYTTDRFCGVGWVEELHETLSNILFLFVALHILGVVFTSIRHRENLPGSMLHGRKRDQNKTTTFPRGRE